MALWIRLSELVSWLILVGSGLRLLEWRAMLRELLTLIFLAEGLALISWRLVLRWWVLEPRLSDLLACLMDGVLL